ncbi:MAG: Ig-like domain-containing protein, partial [Geminicoccaceae bacterium]
MAQNPSNPDTHDKMAIGEETEVAQNAQSPAGGDSTVRPESTATPGTTTANLDGELPNAVDDCAVTDQQTILRVPVLENDQAGGQDLEIIALSQPTSGEASIAEDGSIRFTPDEAGRQEIRYVVDDGTGETADAKANIFVNPDDGRVEQPVLTGVGREDLSEIARSCADGMALDIVRMAGDQIVIDSPPPGQRIQVAANPGQQIDVRDAGFLEPELLHVDGGLLIIAEDGRMIFLENFVAAADNDNPVTLTIADRGPFDGGTILMASIDAGSGIEESNTLIAGNQTDIPNPFGQQPAGGPEHGGGAGFSQYDPGNIGTGPNALGPLGPTAL